MDALGRLLVKAASGPNGSGIPLREGSADEPQRAGFFTERDRFGEPYQTPAYPVILEQRGSVMPKFTLNGEAREVNVPGNNPLLWVLRESLALTGERIRKLPIRLG